MFRLGAHGPNAVAATPVRRSWTSILQRLLNTVEAADYCGSSASTFEKLRLHGSGPIYSKIGRVVYRLADLDEWLAANRRRSTSDKR